MMDKQKFDLYVDMLNLRQALENVEKIFSREERVKFSEEDENMLDKLRREHPTF